MCPSPSPNLLMPGVTAQMRSRTWQLQFWLARHGETDAVSVPLFLLSNCVIYHHIAFLLLSYTTISRNFAYLTLTYRLYRSNTSFSRSQEGGNAHSILHSILNHIIVYWIISVNGCYISHWTVATYHTGLWLAIWKHIVAYWSIFGISGNNTHNFQPTFSYQCGSTCPAKSHPYLCISVHILHTGTYLTYLTYLAYRHISVHISIVSVYI